MLIFLYTRNNVRIQCSKFNGPVFFRYTHHMHTIIIARSVRSFILYEIAYSTEARTHSRIFYMATARKIKISEVCARDGSCASAANYNTTQFGSMRIIPLISRKHADAKSKINYFPTICSNTAMATLLHHPNQVAFSCPNSNADSIPPHNCRSIFVLCLLAQRTALVIGAYDIETNCFSCSAGTSGKRYVTIALNLFYVLCLTKGTRAYQWIERYYEFSGILHSMHSLNFEEMCVKVTANYIFGFSSNTIGIPHQRTPTPPLNFDCCVAMHNWDETWWTCI